MTDYQVLARKYRPKAFAEVLGQDAIVTTLKNALRRSTLAHAYLFCGSRGCGKTTLARLLAKALNCRQKGEDLEPCNSCSSCLEIASGTSLDVIEIDGASHRGIDDVKMISESAGYCAANGSYKVYIIDEVHMLTKEAFNALLKTLEEPPSNVKFFFATTEMHKLPQTIVSRCQRFMLQRIPLALICQKLKRIAQEMKFTVSDKTLLRIARFAEGGLRDAESLFDQLASYSDGEVTIESVQQVLGLMPDELFFSLDEAVCNSDTSFAFHLANTLFSEGKELAHFLDDLTRHYKALLFTKLSSNDLLEDLDAEYKEKIAESAKNYTQEQLLHILDLVMQAQNTMKHAVSQKIALEHLLTKIVRAKLRIPVEYLVRRLSELENRLSEKTLATSKTSVKTFEQKIEAPAKLQTPQRAQPVIEKKEPTQEPTTPLTPEEEAKQKVHHDTLMQFARVELEGTLKTTRRT